MCWITLSPVMKRRLHPRRKYRHHHHNPSVEELIQISSDNPIATTAYPSYRQQRVRIITPTLPIHSDHHHDRYHHPHHRPHIPPDKLHGHGQKRVPPPPPPSPCSERVRVTISESSGPRVRGARYGTVIAEPGRQDIRETTRVALREATPAWDRGRLRRVAGYEVLSAQVPWGWDCVSSTAGSGTRRREGRRGLRYPPFGPASSWM
ncbi:uncharacterized protein BDR25DRAFT_3999 [Lindgomyces ingoldianus]|uniref:Uncharacterized protein n=1 Tax=Lindgomyces ingoldianus TaxID=673940 RepID=A0ACB6RFG2_9PLEO|nr:uncharacterized protein BDR25DRAFT_3999 [Lindgomyces ingoldianus]KAF2477795.1 hypothetical protein BDR25DRAFT_3999 [Lindgomyces ingoldianus]